MGLNREKCTTICLETCPVVSRLGALGLDLRQAQTVVEAASGGLYDWCQDGKPHTTEPNRWGEALDVCDLHPQVADRVGAIADTLGANVLNLAVTVMPAEVEDQMALW